MIRSAGTTLTLIVFIAVAVPGLGQEFKAEPGYTVLFNGKDLSGWKLNKDVLDGKTESANKKWHVTDGAIVIDGGGGGNLYTVQEFNKNFHLKLEFRAANKADSGLFLRGPQLQVRDYPRAGPYKMVKFKDNDWNALDITVQGAAAECKCNGEVIEKAFKVGSKGGIGLQSETGKFEFRHIRIKELP